MNEQTLDQITQEIWESFDDIKYPGDDNIAMVFEIGVEDFIGKTRDEISYEQVLRQQNDLHSFSLEAFCYYLPVFMIAALKRYIGYELSDHLIFILAPPSDYAYDFESRRFREISRILGHKQAPSIITFCEWSRDLSIEDGFRPMKHEEGDFERCVKYWKTRL